jgi:hypothetical protein
MKLVSILCLSLSIAAPTAANLDNVKNCEGVLKDDETGIGKTQVRKIKPSRYFKKLLKFYDDAVSMMALPCVLLLLLLVMLTIHLTSSTCIPKTAGPNLL